LAILQAAVQCLAADQYRCRAVLICGGKWVTFYKDGEELWACNAVYAAAHFDFAPLPCTSSSTAD
jgi:hypothetical protein